MADADFSYPSGRIPDGWPTTLAQLEIEPDAIDDTIDLIFYRQLHSPILARGPIVRSAPNDDELASLTIASRLSERERRDGVVCFDHPSGREVEVRSQSIATALRMLQVEWPKGRRLDALFPDVCEVADDLKLLHRHGMIELRMREPEGIASQSTALREIECRYSDHTTSEYHTVRVASE